jgi:hypothetical protein
MATAWYGHGMKSTQSFKVNHVEILNDSGYNKSLVFNDSLTQLGTILIASLRGMGRWAKRYRSDVTANLRLREAEMAQNENLCWGT